MTKLRRIIKNSFISFVGQGASMLSMMLLSYAYGHYLGASLFGELYFAISFVTLLGTVTDGFGNQIIRDIAQKPENASRYCSNVLFIKLMSWLILFSLMLLTSWQLGYSLEVRILIIICGFDLLCNIIVSTFVSIQYALESTISPVIGGLLEKGLVSLLGFLLLKAGAGVLVMAGILVTGSIVNAIWQAIWYLCRIGTGFVIDPKLIRKLVKADFPFLVSSILMTGTIRIDTVLISLLKNSTVVGLYGAATRITGAMTFLPGTIMMVVMYPILAKLATTSDDEMKVALEKSMNFLLFCIMPVSTIFIVAAPNIIGFLYGRDFSQSVPALQALAPCLILTSINYALVTIVLSKRHDKALPISNGIALFFNIGLNLILIPLFQSVGSGIATSLTDLLLIGINVFILPRSLLPFGSLPVAFKSFIASLLMAAVILLLHTMHIFVILPIAMLVYLVAAFVLRVLPWEDYVAIYNAIFRKGQQSTANDTEGKPEILSFDLPTMPLPAFFGNIALGGTEGTLLDIQMAITGQLPIIRLPQASKRSGLLTKHLFDGSSDRLPDTPSPSYAINRPGRSYCDEPFDVFESGFAPTSSAQIEQQTPAESPWLPSVQALTPANQDRHFSLLQGYADNYGDSTR